MKRLPTVKPRRPYMNGVYLESDRDYVQNNLTLCVALLDRLADKKAEKKRLHKLFKNAAMLAQLSGDAGKWYSQLPKAAREVSFREFERMTKL
jgi:hypothetical protein